MVKYFQIPKLSKRLLSMVGKPHRELKALRLYPMRSCTERCMWRGAFSVMDNGRRFGDFLLFAGVILAFLYLIFFSVFIVFSIVNQKIF